MTEEEMVKLFQEFKDTVYRILEDNTSIFYEELRRTRGEIEKEHSELEDRAITAETKLKLYEAMFEKLNLNLELSKKRGKE